MQASFVSKSHKLQSEPFPQNTVLRGSIDYVQKAENPQYHKIILHTSDQNVPPRKLVFHCSVGCYVGFEICVVDANDVSLEFPGCRWSCDGPFLCQVIQEENRARACIVGPNFEVGQNRKHDFGWFCPGTFTFSFVALTQWEELASECTIIVHEPLIEELSIEMPRLEDAEAVTSPRELGPALIVSRIKTEEVSGTFGLLQSTHLFLERSSSDGSKQVIQTPDTFSITLTRGPEKSVLKEAQHINCSQEKTLTTEYMTDFKKMFENPECLEINMKNKFRTFVAFQPDPTCYPGVTKTFIVKYIRQYIEWGWATKAIRDGDSWKLLEPRLQNNTRSENTRWTPVDWTRTMSEQIIEKDWTAENKFMNATPSQHTYLRHKFHNNGPQQNPF